MQRLEEMTTWHLKKNSAAVAAQQETLIKDIVRLRDEAQVYTNRIAVGTIELGRINLKYGSECSTALQAAERNVQRHELALQIIEAELRIKELQKVISMPGIDQRIVIEEMSKLNAMTLRRKEVDDLIPYKLTTQQNKEWLAQAIAEHEQAKQKHSLTITECDAPEYLSLRHELQKLELTKTQLLKQIHQKEVLYQANAKKLKEMQELMTARMQQQDPIHAAYHEILQEFQHTLNQRPLNSTEPLVDLLNKGQIFLDSVILSERLTREEKTTLLTDADALLKDLHNPECWDRFYESLNNNEEKLSTASMVAGVSMIIASMLGMIATFIIVATGFGLPLLALGVGASLLSGILGTAMVVKSIQSPVSQNGNTFFHAALAIIEPTTLMQFKTTQ